MKNTENMEIVNELRLIMKNNFCYILEYALIKKNYPADIVRDTIVEYVKDTTNEIINKKEHYEQEQMKC